MIEKKSFTRYIALANATGTGSFIAFIVSGVLFFSLGWYMKANQIKTKGEQVVAQSVDNQTITEEAIRRQKHSSEMLSESLSYIGYDSSDIEELLNGKLTRLDKLKNKFTKVIRGKPIYIPRDDCENDFLGEESSNEANRIILDGLHKRYKPND